MALAACLGLEHASKFIDLFPVVEFRPIEKKPDFSLLGAFVKIYLNPAHLSQPCDKIIVEHVKSS